MYVLILYFIFCIFAVDSSIMLPKSRRARSINNTKLKPILQLYNKLCELVSLIGNLVAMENLTDLIILKVDATRINSLISHSTTTPFMLSYNVLRRKTFMQSPIICVFSMNKTHLRCIGQRLSNILQHS